MFAKDNRYLSSSGCPSCIQYEEEISILQDKLMETHNKLIDQLDVCRQQEATIIELTKKIIDLEANKQEDSFQQQSFGMITSKKINLFGDDNKQNGSKMPRNYVQFTLNNSQQPSQYNSPNFVQNRTQLLQTDLQAMRLKVLQQITQKNSLKEQLKQIKTKFKKQTINYQRQIQQLQNNHEHLLREYQYISKNLEVFKTRGSAFDKEKNNYNSTEIRQLSQKCAQYQRLYKLQVSLNQSQNIKFAQLRSFLSVEKQKVKQLESMIHKQPNSSKCNTSAQCQRDYNDENCITIRKTPGKLRQKSNKKDQNKFYHDQILNQKFKMNPSISNQKLINKENALRDTTNLCMQKQNKQFYKSKKQKESEKKQDYESTKQLIRKLQEAQNLTRKRKKGQMLG